MTEVGASSKKQAGSCLIYKDIASAAESSKTGTIISSMFLHAKF